jgi:hypothetical protein
VERIKQSCVKSPERSITCQEFRSSELEIPKTMIQNVTDKHLCLNAYNIQLKHEIKPDDQHRCYDFASLMLNTIHYDETFLLQISFTDEATFHMNGCVNRHNCQIWGLEQQNEICEYVRGKTKT